MSLPMENATVLAVTTGDLADDFDNPDALASPKWSGMQRCYLVTSSARVEGPSGVTVVPTERVVVPADWARTVGVDTDDLLSIDPDDGVPINRRALVIAASRPPAGIPIPDALATASIQLGT